MHGKQGLGAQISVERVYHIEDNFHGVKFSWFRKYKGIYMGSLLFFDETTEFLPHGNFPLYGYVYVSTVAFPLPYKGQSPTLIL